MDSRPREAPEAETAEQLTARWNRRSRRVTIGGLGVVAVAVIGILELARSFHGFALLAVVAAAVAWAIAEAIVERNRGPKEGA
jgi:hypothetical protein